MKREYSKPKAERLEFDYTKVVTASFDPTANPGGNSGGGNSGGGNSGSPSVTNTVNPIRC